MRYVLAPLATDTDMDIKYRLDVLSRLSMVRNAMETCRSNIKTLEKNANLIQKQIQLTALEALRKELEQQIGKENRRVGSVQESIQYKKEQIEQSMAVQMRSQTEVSRLAAEAGDYFAGWIKEYDFGAAASMTGFPEFAAVYDRLKESELLDYEEKVESARKAAEEEFREQFLAKLQENMKQAQGEFKELNKALKDISFSNEKYEFLFMPRKRLDALIEKCPERCSYLHVLLYMKEKGIKLEQEILSFSMSHEVKI